MRIPRLALPAAAAVAALLAPPLYARPAPAPLPSVTELPLVEVPAARPGGHTLAVVLTGDGDWAPFVRGLAQDLAERGIASVALKSRSFLSSPRTPDETAAAVEAILRHYLPAWGRSEAVLVGYSRGADLAPFVANRLPADLRARVRLTALISPGESESFTFHAVDLIADVRRPGDLPILPEALRMRGSAVLCLYGRREKDSLCTAAPDGLMHVVARDGGHRDHDPVAAAALIAGDLDGTR
jgi:type IV secretory pathway VirJ component